MSVLMISLYLFEGWFQFSNKLCLIAPSWTRFARLAGIMYRSPGKKWVAHNIMQVAVKINLTWLIKSDIIHVLKQKKAGYYPSCAKNISWHHNTIKGSAFHPYQLQFTYVLDQFMPGRSLTRRSPKNLVLLRLLRVTGRFLQLYGFFPLRSFV